MLWPHWLPANNFRESHNARAAYNSSSDIPNKPSEIWPNCTNSTCEGLSLRCTSCTHREDDKDIHSQEQLKQGVEDTAARGTAAPPRHGNAKPLSNAVLCCLYPTRACFSPAPSARQVCFCSAPCSGRVWDLGPEDHRVENT